MPSAVNFSHSHTKILA